MNSAAAEDRARRMRRTATGLLIGMAVLFAISHALLGRNSAWGYPMAFSEAAMVGGLADWFAVTALFRRPLGLPIPHTAIIPENKDRIADTMAAFLRTNFLVPQVVARRMRGMNLALAAGNFLTEPSAGDRLAIRGGFAELFAEVLESLDPERLGEQVKSGLKNQLERIEIAPLFGRMLSAAIADGKHLPLVEGAIRFAAATIEDNETLIRTMIHERANALFRFTGLDEKLANALLDGAYKMLAQILVDPSHPVRQKMETGLETLAHNLVHDPETRERLESFKREALNNPAIGEWWQGVWERIRRSLIDIARDPAAVFGGQLGEMLAELGDALKTDLRLQLQINRFARRTLVGVVNRYGDQIVRLVSETVKRWDAGTITGRLEGAVGRDLQFIRINGTMVGGLVGLVLYVISGWL